MAVLPLDWFTSPSQDRQRRETVHSAKRWRERTRERKGEGKGGGARLGSSKWAWIAKEIDKQNRRRKKLERGKGAGGLRCL